MHMAWKRWWGTSHASFFEHGANTGRGPASILFPGCGTTLVGDQLPMVGFACGNAVDDKEENVLAITVQALVTKPP